MYIALFRMTFMCYMKSISIFVHSLKMLQEFQNAKNAQGTVDAARVEEKFNHLDLTEEEQRKVDEKRKVTVGTFAFTVFPEPKITMF